MWLLCARCCCPTCVELAYKVWIRLFSKACVLSKFERNWLYTVLYNLFLVEMIVMQQRNMLPLVSVNMVGSCRLFTPFPKVGVCVGLFVSSPFEASTRHTMNLKRQDTTSCKYWEVHLGYECCPSNRNVGGISCKSGHL
eukprot:2148328-Amphidinium_carterae.4